MQSDQNNHVPWFTIASHSSCTSIGEDVLYHNLTHSTVDMSGNISLKTAIVKLPDPPKVKAVHSSASSPGKRNSGRVRKIHALIILYPFVDLEDIKRKKRGGEWLVVPGE